ncbi:unnamed protein product [Cyprideis torosa]|uniref:Solute carrier family 35 member F6 n=1 Tax=Cyprideis torosa TaxID=163714 RepID=A0A7R8ZL73_9CRUS|nr:unnamed protein product [Cyprideis torosa]CAG0892784.1 unnamed protein product [Cyprideis torosa]
MQWSPSLAVLASVMLASGSISTIFTKWIDRTESVNSAGQLAPYHHPFLQSLYMFFGETLCLLVWTGFKVSGKVFGVPSAENDFSRLHLGLDENPTFSYALFIPATICDLVSTSVMNIGLALTYASSFQMLRGASIIFTAFFARLWLGRQLRWWEGLGIIMVLLGLVIVGFSDLLGHPPLKPSEAEESGSNRPIPIDDILTGDILIVLGQIIAAFQVVYEEKYIINYDMAPLVVVGVEGIFGFFIMIFALVVLYFVPAGPPIARNPRGTLEDAPDGLIQIQNNLILLVPILGTTVCVAVFNFTGLSFTKQTTSTTRMVLDSVRTIIVWSVTLSLGWQEFHFLQLIGFTVFLMGICSYNDLFVTKAVRYCCPVLPEEEEELDLEMEPLMLESQASHERLVHHLYTKSIPQMGRSGEVAVQMSLDETLHENEAKEVHSEPDSVEVSKQSSSSDSDPQIQPSKDRGHREQKAEKVYDEKLSIEKAPD